MRALRSISLLASLVLLSFAGCKAPACRDHTVLLSITFDGPAAGADAIALAISVMNGPAKTSQAPLQPGTTHGTVEITFPSGYPSGQVVTVRVDAQKGGVTLASASISATLSDSCAALAVDFTGGDAGVTDGGGNGDGGDGGGVVCPDCQLFALESEIGSTSDTVYLEGKFDSSATVTFPGGDVANATVIGPNRASVVVPPTAGEGLLSVTTGGAVTRALPFRRASFVLGLGTFRNAYEQADYARQMPPLNTWGAAAASDGRHLWILGGTYQSEDGTANVAQALIDADGTLTGFTQLTTQLTVKRALLSAVRIGNFVYAIGGRDGTGQALASVESAPINSDGTLGAFQVVQSLTTARWAHASAVAGHYLYVLGGYTGPKCGPPAPLASVERAPINPDGTLGAFADAGITLTTTRTSLAAVVSGSALYAVGGDGSTTIDMAAIGSDGTLAAFKSAIGVLPQARGGASAFAFGGKLYVVGGFSTDGNPPSSFVSAIKPDGTLGTFTAQSPDPSGSYAASAIVGDYLYTIGGGYSLCCSACAAAAPGGVYRASLDVGAGASTFAATPSVELKTPRQNFALVALGPYVYAIAGQLDGTQSDVERAMVGPDGSLGAFGFVSGEALKTQRAGAAVAIAGDWLYLVGGSAITGGAPLTTVEAAPIAADGTLGAFDFAKDSGGAQVTLASSRGQSLLALGDELCALGGSGGTGSVVCTKINPDGTLAASFAAPTTPTVGLVNLHGEEPISAALGGSAYVLTGDLNGSNSDQAPLDPLSGFFSGTFSSVSLGISLGVGQSGLAIGDNLLLLGGENPMLGNYSSQVTLANISAAGVLGTFAATSNLMYASAFQRNLVIGNHVYVLGGTNSGTPSAAESAELR